MGYFLEIGDGLFSATIFFVANAPSPPRPTMIGAIVLVIALIVAVLVGWWNWREAHEELTSDSPEDLLSAFEEAHADGEIDDEEMWRLRAKLTGTQSPLPPSVKTIKAEEKGPE